MAHAKNQRNVTYGLDMKIFERFNKFIETTNTTAFGVNATVTQENPRASFSKHPRISKSLVVETLIAQFLKNHGVDLTDYTMADIEKLITH